ncbi:hypothetical protein LguiB_013423 [Lonicera macranthoides]
MDRSSSSRMVIGPAKLKPEGTTAADQWFKEAKERQPTLNAIIYGNLIYAHWIRLRKQILKDKMERAMARLLRTTNCLKFSGSIKGDEFVELVMFFTGVLYLPHSKGSLLINGEEAWTMSYSIQGARSRMLVVELETSMCRTRQKRKPKGHSDQKLRELPETAEIGSR